MSAETHRPYRFLRSAPKPISIGLILLCIIAVAGGTAMAISNDNVSISSNKGETMSDTTIDSTSIQSASSPDAADDSAKAGQSAANTSSTTITINGQITHVDGNTSYDNTYTDDSGSHVSISVHNNSSTSGSSTDEKEEHAP